MKNHFKIEAWVIWLLTIIPVIVAFVAALIRPQVKAWH